MYKIRRKVKIDGVVRNVQCMVIPEKQIVIARIRNCEFDAINALIRDTGFAVICPERFMMQHSYEATANLHPDDSFDVEKGCDVAIEKLGRNYIRARNRKQEMMLSWIQEHMSAPRYKEKKIR